MTVVRMLWWLLAVAGVSILGILLSQQRALDPVQNLTLLAASPLEAGLFDLGEPVADFFGGIVNRGELVRENRQLREEVERLQAELAQQEDAALRIQELEGLLEVKKGRPQQTLLVAEVIAQDPGGVKEAIAIDRGAQDGLEEGMVVLSEGASLVGTVTRVLDDFSWVTLVTDPDSAVNAQVLLADSLARGVASGDLRNSLLLDMVPSEADLEEGALVTTSGLGGNYPRALLIGSVVAVDERPQALFQKATLEPAADLSRLETVLVLTSFIPARLQGP
ncbi:MAG: rod shape-determining protein MreC [Chloroflexi bacterium]|nr:rod shape-determining protein MreC [Chloroflexota bacterium]